MSRVENLLIELGGKSVSLFGANHLWNLLKITTLLVYLAPESTYYYSTFKDFLFLVFFVAMWIISKACFIQILSLNFVIATNM